VLSIEIGSDMLFSSKYFNNRSLNLSHMLKNVN
jgi:hypothetical protein